MSGFSDPRLMAIRLGREGDLTGSDAMLWSHTRGLSYTASPVLHENKFYALTDNGMLSCFNSTAGEPYYHRRRLPQPDNFRASPVAAGGALYLPSERRNHRHQAGREILNRGDQHARGPHVR